MTLEEEVFKTLSEENPEKNSILQKLFERSRKEDDGKSYVEAYNRYIDECLTKK